MKTKLLINSDGANKIFCRKNKYDEKIDWKNSSFKQN